MGGREEIGQHERSGLRDDGGRVGDSTRDALGDAVQRGVGFGGAHRIGVLVHGEDTGRPESDGCDGENSRAGAEIHR